MQVDALQNKETVEELRKQWKTLWRERIDDKVRAEGIADKDYVALFVERGTVIFATRKFKMLSFKEILELHGVTNAERIIGPNPSIGGWGKFIRTMITPQKRGKQYRQYLEEEKQKQQLKKGGRGWLHL